MYDLDLAYLRIEPINKGDRKERQECKKRKKINGEKRKEGRKNETLEKERNL